MFWNTVRKIALAREIRFERDIQASAQTELVILGTAMIALGAFILFASKFADTGEV